MFEEKEMYGNVRSAITKINGKIFFNLYQLKFKLFNYYLLTAHFPVLIELYV